VISPLSTIVAAVTAIALVVSVPCRHVVAQFVGDGVVDGDPEGRLAAVAWWAPGYPRLWMVLHLCLRQQYWPHLGLALGPLRKVGYLSVASRVRRAPAAGGQCRVGASLDPVAVVSSVDDNANRSYPCWLRVGWFGEVLLQPLDKVLRAFRQVVLQL
jgi:hypothetical protein